MFKCHSLFSFQFIFLSFFAIAALSTNSFAESPAKSDPKVSSGNRTAPNAEDALDEKKGKEGGCKAAMAVVSDQCNRECKRFCSPKGSCGYNPSEKGNGCVANGCSKDPRSQKWICAISDVSCNCVCCDLSTPVGASDFVNSKQDILDDLANLCADVLIQQQEPVSVQGSEAHVPAAAYDNEEHEVVAPAPVGNIPPALRPR